MLNNTYIYFSIVVPILGALLFIVNKYLSVKNVYSEKYLHSNVVYQALVKLDLLTMLLSY